MYSFFKRKTREREDLIFKLGEKEIKALEHKKPCINVQRQLTHGSNFC